MDGNAQLLLRIAAEVLLDKFRREPIKPRRHRRVSGEEVARPRDSQRDIEGLAAFLHENPGAFQNSESRMPFIEVTDFRTDAERAEQPPAADSEDQFLVEPQLRPAAIQLARDPAVGGGFAGSLLSSR